MFISLSRLYLTLTTIKTSEFSTLGRCFLKRVRFRYVTNHLKRRHYRVCSPAVKYNRESEKNIENCFFHINLRPGAWTSCNKGVLQKLKRHGNGGSCLKKHEKLKIKIFAERVMKNHIYSSIVLIQNNICFIKKTCVYTRSINGTLKIPEYVMILVTSLWILKYLPKGWWKIIYIVP
jgi:hypothetical protein